MRGTRVASGDLASSTTACCRRWSTASQGVCEIDPGAVARLQHRVLAWQELQLKCWPMHSRRCSDGEHGAACCRTTPRVAYDSHCARERRSHRQMTHTRRPTPATTTLHGTCQAQKSRTPEARPLSWRERWIRRRGRDWWWRWRRWWWARQLALGDARVTGFLVAAVLPTVPHARDSESRTLLVSCQCAELVNC